MNRKERITLSSPLPSRKILLLHGDRQVGQLLLGRISSLKRKLLKPRSHNESDGITNESSSLEDYRIEIVAPDGPFVWKLDPKIHRRESDKGNGNGNCSEENNLMRTWWYRDGDDHHGVEESLNMLHSLWLGDSGFEGILGFSRGARLAHYIALLNKATNGDYFKNLRYIISASGYGGYGLPTNFPNNVSMCQHLSKKDIENAMPLEIRSMHIQGINDNLVPVEASRALLPSYVDPVVYEHEGGHHIPMRAADVREILKFIDSSCISNEKRDIILMSKNNMIPDEEHAQLQIDECESLSLIFPEEFQLLSTTKNGDQEIVPGETLYNHPIIYSIQLKPPLQQLEDEDTVHLWPKSAISLQVQYTVDYPDTPPIFALQHDMNLLEFKISQNDACLKAVERAAKVEEGMPCVMSCVYAGREFFEAGGLKSALIAVDEKEEDCQNSNHLEGAEADVDDDAGGDGILKSSTEERIEKCMTEGLEISYQIGGYKYVKNNTNAITNTEVIDKKDFISGKGGSWKFTIGLVGKPSAGKRYVMFIL